MSAFVRIAVIASVVAIVTPPMARTASAGGWGSSLGKTKSSFGKAKNPFGNSGGNKKKYVQPPVTSGGLYTKQTYPVTELQRPLTITQGLLELRAALDADVSAGNPFNIWRTDIRARYGVKDNFELQAGFNGLLNGTIAHQDVQYELDLGFESAIAYNLVDFRFAAEMPLAPSFKFDLAAGVPVRYELKPQIAIVAFDKVLTVHTDGNDPDLSLDLGVIYQALPNLALFARTGVTLPGFDPSGDLAIPAIAAVQFTPINTVDLGLQLTLANLKPASGSKLGPLDQRAVLLFGRLRI